MKRLVLFALSLVLTIAGPSWAQLPDFTQLVEKEGQAVVNISVTQVVRMEEGPGGFHGLPEDDPFWEFFRRFMPPHGRGGERGPRDETRRGAGSGFFVSTDGYILTNAHVVDDAEEVVVKLTDKREFNARVIGTDSRTDIALIKIDASGLPKVTVGDPNRLRVGEWVVAIGSPFGFENSVTAGIVSAKGRSLPSENYVPFIQTDVAVNPGNSGGPLFNMRGEVVGVNSQIISRSGGYMGLSFAIPIDVALEVADQLKIHGKVSRGRLGVVIQEVTAELAKSFGLARPAGALIADVEQGSPADKAGLEASDIVLKFGGRTVESSIDLPRMVGATRPGTKVPLEIWRKGKAQTVTVTVGELPEETVGAEQPRKSAKRADRAGFVLSDLSPSQKKALDIDQGVYVEETQGAAARVGIRRGDVILAVNNQQVNSVERFAEILANTKKGQVIALLVKRGKTSTYVPLTIPTNGE
jgi:serine protease Do